MVLLCAVASMSHSCLELGQTLYDAGDLAFIINAGPMIEPMTKHEYHKKLKRLPYGLFGHAGQQEDAKNVHAGLGSTAKGILGRLSQAMGSQTQPFSTHMYSMAGNQKSTEGWERHSPDILANTVEGECWTLACMACTLCL